MSEVIWHDLESGPYTLDLPLWEELAASAPPGVLDVGAGTGRTALHLARAGHEVTALDIEAELLAALSARAAAEGLAIRTVTADAQAFDLGRRYGAVLVPQSSIQLLDDRPAALRCLRAHVDDDGVVAIAFTPEFFFYDGPHLPAPDEARGPDGRTYVSQPVALRDLGDRAAIDRVRRAGDGSPAAHRTELHKLTLDVLRDEAAAAGLRFDRTLPTPEDHEYTPATVAVFRP